MSNEESEAAAARRQYDEDESSADVLTAAESHGEAIPPPRLLWTPRLLRGRVVVRELEVPASRSLWTPDRAPREIHTHRGIVLAMGPPAKMPLVYSEGEWRGGHEVPHGFRVGDTVQYHFEHHQEAWTMTWIDGKPCTYLAQHNVDAVIE